VSPRLERVRVPETYPRERVVLGELHLLRGRLDEVLDEIADVIERVEVADEAWPRVEEAARLARRALAAAVETVPLLPAIAPQRACCESASSVWTRRPGGSGGARSSSS